MLNYNHKFVLVYMFTIVLFYIYKPLFGNFYLKQNSGFIFIMAILLLQTVLYAWGYKYAQKFSIKNFLLVAAAITFLTLFVHTIASDDLFSYIAWGRLTTFFHKNPYFNTFNDQNDILADSLRTVWTSKPTPLLYGPVFILINSALAFLGGSNLMVTLIIYKVFFAFSYLITVGLVYKITHSKTSLYLFIFNPVIIFESLINNHIDIFVLLILLWAIYMVYKNKFYLSTIFFVLASFIKISSIVFLPFVILFALFKVNKIKYIVFLSALMLVSIMLYIPFISIPEAIDLLLSSSKETIFPALLAYIIPLKITKIMFYLIYAVTLFALFKVNKRKQNLVTIMLFIYFVAILLYFPLVLPWYFIVPIALASIEVRVKPVFTLTAMSMLLYLVVR